MAKLKPSDYDIVGMMGNRMGTLRKVTPKYFQASDGAKYLRDVFGGQFSIRKKGLK